MCHVPMDVLNRLSSSLYLQTCPLCRPVCRSGRYLSKPDATVQNFIDLQQQVNVSTINYEGKTYKQVTPFSKLPKAKEENQQDTILGYPCQQVSYVSFSNKIKVWYTDETEAKGSPLSKYLPSKNALVLKIEVK